LSKFIVEFFSRSGCHLCDEARPVVEAAVQTSGGSMVEVDIESSDDLVRRYGERVPVVVGPDGGVLAEGAVDPKQLKKRLRRIR